MNKIKIVIKKLLTIIEKVILKSNNLKILFIEFLLPNKKNFEIRRILILFYIPINSKKESQWHDGFTSAIRLLEGRYSFTYFNLARETPTIKFLNSFDLILVKSIWGWIPDNFIQKNKMKIKPPKALLMSGCSKPPFITKMLTYRIIFFETYWYKPQISKHPLIIHAFGIDTEVMIPKTMKKEYDFLTVGEPANYKRHDLFLKKPGGKIVIGDFSQYEESIKTKYCNNNCEVLDFMTYEKLADYYNKSKCVYIPANIGGGGERSVLEARSCGIPVIIENDNCKLAELLESPIWSHYYYANQLDFGIKKIFRIKDNPMKIMSSKKVLVGLDSFHNGNLVIKGDENVTIGSYCAFGENIRIITSNHDYNFTAVQGTIYNKAFFSKHPGELLKNKTRERTKGDVIIGNDVWIGDNVIILSGVKIGDGACIAASSVVTKDVENYSVYGGVPAKKLKNRFKDDKSLLLLKMKWWNWSFKEIQENKEFFFTNHNTNK